MTLSDIKSMSSQVHELLEEKSILFLWTTNAFLLKGLEVLRSWGFDYQSSIIWDKSPYGNDGTYSRVKHEILLIGTRGEALYPKFKPDSVQAGAKRAHSQKPEEFYEMIEKMYPKQSKLELFSRRKRTGWTSWGNQVETSSSLK